MNLNTNTLKRGDKLTVTRAIVDKNWTVPAGVTAVVDRVDVYPASRIVTGARVDEFAETRIVTLKLSQVIPNLPHPDGFSADGCDLLCIDTSDDLSGAEMLDCLALTSPIVGYFVSTAEAGCLPNDSAYVSTVAEVLDIIADTGDDMADADPYLTNVLRAYDAIKFHGIDARTGEGLMLSDSLVMAIEPLDARALLDLYNANNEYAQENRTYETASTLHEMAEMFEDVPEEVADIRAALDGASADSDRIFSVDLHIGGYRVYGADSWDDLGALYADENEREFMLETLNRA
jgi:hypothetical protein